MWIRLILCITSFTYSGCVHSDQQVQNRVWIDSIRPVRLVAGSTISISGGGYGLEGDEDGVWVAGEPLEIMYWSEKRIDCRLPFELIGQAFLVIRSDSYISLPLPLTIYDSTNESLEQFLDQSIMPEVNE